MADFDVIVAGGGPAGCTAALALSQAGWRTAVLDRPRRLRPPTAESLPGAAIPLLERLHLRDEFLAQEHRHIRANRSCWGQAHPSERPALIDAHGQGWHIDRARFDALLRSAAQSAGARFMDGRPREVQARLGHFELASVAAAPATSAGPVGVTLSTRSVVDATGRSASVARMLGAKMLQAQALIAVCAQSAASARPGGQDAASFVETTPEGWWYSAPTPTGSYAVQFFTLASVWGEHRDLAWHLRAAPLTRERVGTLAPQAPMVCSARSGCANPSAGSGWVAVGDAACACDPLAASGLIMALRSGLRGAHALARWLSAGQADELERYSRMQEASFAQYWAQRQQIYAMERRWPRSPFWGQIRSSARAPAPLRVRGPWGTSESFTSSGK